MTVHEILDKMEFLVHNAKKVPFTSHKAIDETALLALIDELHQNLPADIKQARWTLEEQERLIQEAQREAGRINTVAAQRADDMVQKHELVKHAQSRAEAIVKEAEHKAAAMRKSAEDYAVEQLQQLETQLLRAVATIKKGIETLKK